MSREADITTLTQIKKKSDAQDLVSFLLSTIPKKNLDFCLNITLANAHITENSYWNMNGLLIQFHALVVSDTDLIIFSSGSRSLQVLGASRNVTMWLFQLIWKVKSTCGGMNYVQTLASGKMWVIPVTQIELIWILSISNHAVYSVTLYLQYKLHLYCIAHVE